MAIPVSGANSWLLINGFPLSFAEDDENSQAKAKENHNNTLEVTSYAPKNIQISVGDELLKTAYYGYWYWQPKEYAGVYQLQISAPGYPLQTAKVLVLPSKVSYEHYKFMLEDISEIALDLLFSINSPAGEKMTMQHGKEQISALREYNLIQPMVYEMKDVIAQIRRMPHQALHEHSEQRLLNKVLQFSGALLPVPGPVEKLSANAAAICKREYLPRAWTVQQNELTFDVYENRLLKHFLLHQLTTKISSIRESAAQEKKRRESQLKMKLSNGWKDDETPHIEKLEEVLEECEKMARWCGVWGSEQFLKSVCALSVSGKATQYLLKNPAYNRFYKFYLRFQQQLKISLETDKFVTTLAMRHMWDIYQRWSIFRLTDIILDFLEDAGYKFSFNNIYYEVEKDRFQFDIKINTESIVLTKDEVKVVFKYEPNYPKLLANMQGLGSTDYKQLTPDMSVEIYRQNKPWHVLIFDAKYRYRRGDDEIFCPNDEDLDKMRKYRDLIRYKAYNPRNPTQKPQRIVTSAYILYPGTYLEHERDEPEIGALPLVPKQAKATLKKVKDAIKDILCAVKLID